MVVGVGMCMRVGLGVSVIMIVAVHVPVVLVHVPRGVRWSMLVGLRWQTQSTSVRAQSGAVPEAKHTRHDCARRSPRIASMIDQTRARRSGAVIEG